MMMMVFITIKRCFVPLIEGLCTQIYFRFEIISGFAFTSFAFLFLEENICQRKKLLFQDLIPPHGIYIHMCTLYTCTNTYMPRFSPFGFSSFGPSRCLIPTPGLTYEYPICVVCAPKRDSRPSKPIFTRSRDSIEQL